MSFFAYRMKVMMMISLEKICTFKKVHSSKAWSTLKFEMLLWTLSQRIRGPFRGGWAFVTTTGYIEKFTLRNSMSNCINPNFKVPLQTRWWEQFSRKMLMIVQLLYPATRFGRPQHRTAANSLDFRAGQSTFIHQIHNFNSFHFCFRSSQHKLF